jgi:hypothetical protein
MVTAEHARSDGVDDIASRAARRVSRVLTSRYGKCGEGRNFLVWERLLLSP